MTLRTRPIRWNIHPVLPLVWMISALLGGWSGALAAALALLLHECGHLLAARWLGCPITEVEITPWGGLMTLEEMESVPPWRWFLLAAAGPLCSLLGCFLAAEMHRLGVHFFFARRFARMNLLLLLMNLLPALPLDGGWMLLALLRRFRSHARAARCLTLVGYILGGALCGLSLLFACRGRLVVAPCFAGLYLIYAAAAERKASTARYVTALIARRQRLERGQTLPVEILAAGADTPARMLLRSLHPGHYHIVHVLSPDGQRTVATLEEQALCDLLLDPNDPALGSRAKKEPGCAPGPDSHYSGLRNIKKLPREA